MAIGDGGGYAPVTPHHQRVIDAAERHGQAIECDGSGGVTHTFAYTGVSDLWACHQELSCGASRTWLIDREMEETLENCIRRCDPHVRLIDESESAFGENDA